MAFLPESPPSFPASNLAVTQRKWGRSSCFLRQSIAVSSPLTPWCPWRHARASSSAQNRAKPWLCIAAFERIYIFSPSVNIDDGWIPVKKYIEEDLGVNTEREQTYWDEWDEAALRRIIQQQRKITEASKKLEMKKLCRL